MENSSIIQTGSFTGDGSNQLIEFQSQIDWIEVVSLSYADSATAQDKGYRYFWQRGMGTNGLVEYHTGDNQEQSVDGTGTGAFTLYDTSTFTGYGDFAITATNAAQPTFLTGTTTGLEAGAVVRLKNALETTGSLLSPISGLDFTIGTVSASTSFQLARTLPNNVGASDIASGTYHLVAPSLATYKLFTPRERVIAEIDVSTATAPIIHTLVDHGFSVGDIVQFSFSNSNFGTTGLDGKKATITNADNAGYFTIDLDMTGYTAFEWETVFNNCNPYPSVRVIGSNTSSTYSDNGTIGTNHGVVGMILKGGALLPGGDSGTYFWRAGTSWDNR